MGAMLANETVAAQQFELTVKNIMRGPELIGTAPTGLRGGGFFRGGPRFSWSPDSRYIYFRWKQPGVDTTLVVYRVRPGRAIERLENADRDTIVAGDAVWSPDLKRAVFVLKGDLVLWERGRSRKLTNSTGFESNPTWSADGKTIYFQRDGNVFALGIETPSLAQLTDIRRGDPPKEKKDLQGQRRFLVEQQKELFDFIGSDEYRGQPWNRKAERDSTRPKPFYPGRGKNVNGMRITPDGKYVLFNVSEQPRNARRVKMAVWLTEDGYEDTYTGRTKVGDAQSKTRAAVLEVATGKVTFLADSIGAKREDGGKRERDVQVAAVSPNSRYALLRVTSKDNEDRWHVVVDLNTMAETVVNHDHDDAWLTFPGPALNFLAGFMPDGETVYLGSEKSGWSHIYTVPATGGEPRALTSGKWEVLSAELSRDRKTWYITANREGFAEVHFYTMPAGGGELTRVTMPVGRQDVTPSPDGKWLAVSHSVANHPPELYIQRNRTGADMQKITESTTEEWRSYPWIKPEIVMVTASDGVEVPARLYRPQGNVAPEGRRPAVIFVHGAGYLQNVHNWWSGYFREYMFNHLLASRGYTVLDMDYRGSAGHGRDWRTAIYRYMGNRDLGDEVDGARWLVSNMGVDSTRIGIYGGSYGGFMTLMAMFTRPGIFAAGAALRPVTDWAHYNHGYTSSILNEPQNDTLAYRRSSPIYFADGLEGHLLIAHGMVDDNVLFYDTARLTERLIELGKENWEVAIYPAERHGFQRAASWTDEYRRILKLFEDNLK